MKDINFLFAIKPKIQQSYLFYIEKFQSEGGINMAVAIKRVIQFSYAKMNSVQSEQTRIRAKNKYKNDHICEEFKKFNLHPINNTEGLTYNQYFKKYCKRRTGGKKKVDVVSEMGEKDFYLDKLYTGKGGGKTTCCVESMVISLNDRIDATEEVIKAYQEDPDNQQKMDAFVTYITKSDPRFRNCRFLNVDWHFDEVYTPYEKKSPTEEFPDGEIVVGTPKISIHAHITYIPLAKDIDKNGKEYLNLNRGAIWKSRTAAYNQSYSQFNDDIYEEVERKFGYDRGELYPSSEKDRNKDMNIQDWIIVHNGEMEKQYKAQEELKLKTQEEKTKTLNKEYDKAQQERIDAAEADLQKIKDKQKAEQDILDELTKEDRVLVHQIKYKNNLQSDIQKKINENENRLAEIKKLNEEANRQLELSMKDSENKEADNKEKLKQMQAKFDEEVEKLSNDLVEYEAWKEIYIVDENGDFVQDKGKLFLTPKGRKIMREIQARQFQFTKMPIEEVVACMENVDIVDYINKMDEGNVRKQLLEEIKKEKAGEVKGQEYVSDEEINERLSR